MMQYGGYQASADDYYGGQLPQRAMLPPGPSRRERAAQKSVARDYTAKGLPNVREVRLVLQWWQ